MLARVLTAVTLVLWAFGTYSTALALTPRVAICGRVTSFIDAAPPADRIVRLGTQEPRRLSMGTGVPQVGQEICIWGYDVENFNPPAPDPAPKGIVGYRIAAVASIGCAEVTDRFASFVMPGQEFEVPQNIASLTLALTTPAENGCARMAVGAQGNPVAVVVPRTTGTSPALASSTPRPSVASLPVTSSTDDREAPALALLAMGALAAATALVLRGCARRAIPS